MCDIFSLAGLLLILRTYSTLQYYHYHMYLCHTLLFYRDNLSSHISVRCGMHFWGLTVLSGARAVSGRSSRVAEYTPPPSLQHNISSRRYNSRNSRKSSARYVNGSKGDERVLIKYICKHVYPLILAIVSWAVLSRHWIEKTWSQGLASRKKVSIFSSGLRFKYTRKTWEYTRLWKPLDWDNVPLRIGLNKRGSIFQWVVGDGLRKGVLRPDNELFGNRWIEIIPTVVM